VGLFLQPQSSHGAIHTHISTYDLYGQLQTEHQLHNIAIRWDCQMSKLHHRTLSITDLWTQCTYHAVRITEHARTHADTRMHTHIHITLGFYLTLLFFQSSRIKTELVFYRPDSKLFLQCFNTVGWVTTMVSGLQRCSTWFFACTQVELEYKF